MSEFFPLELVFEILLLLPLLTLVRLRVVSKRWQTLIDSPTFQKSHFNHQSNNNDDYLIMCLAEHRARYIDLYSFWNCNSPPTQKLKYPPGITSDFTYGLPPINGVLCLLTRRNDVAILWNPFIRKYLKVPQPPHHHPYRLRHLSDDDCMWSFGYDSHSDDYKLVFISRIKIIPAKNGGGRYPVWVYSVKVGCWKSIGVMPYSIAYSFDTTFVRGALHWSGGDDENIIALDLGNLEYNLLPIPRPRDTEKAGFHIGVTLDGCLYFHSFSYWSPAFDLWIMKDKDYGPGGVWTKLNLPAKECWTKLISSTTTSEKESWTNKLVLPAIHRIYSSTTSRRMLMPLACDTKKKLLLFVEHSTQMVVGYDFETRSFKIVFHDLGAGLLYSLSRVYAPSLLFPACDPSLTIFK